MHTTSQQQVQARLHVQAISQLLVLAVVEIVDLKVVQNEGKKRETL